MSFEGVGAARRNRSAGKCSRLLVDFVVGDGSIWVARPTVPIDAVPHGLLGIGYLPMPLKSDKRAFWAVAAYNDEDATTAEGLNRLEHTHSTRCGRPPPTITAHGSTLNDCM
jgi:hypothetical protein